MKGLLILAFLATSALCVLGRPQFYVRSAEVRIRVTENMVIFESGLPRGRNDTISITDDNPKIWWQSNEVYSWPQPPLISHRKCTGGILASAASYLL